MALPKTIKELLKEANVIRGQEDLAPFTLHDDGIRSNGIYVYCGLQRKFLERYIAEWGQS